MANLSSGTDADLERSLLTAIIEGSNDAIVSKTLDSIVTSWNPAAEELFGWSAQEMIGQSIVRIIPEELRFEEDQILAQLRAGHRIERYETRRVRKDGAMLEVSLTISPVRDSSGTIVGASKIAHDITQQKRATVELSRLTGNLKDREAELSRLLIERETLLESERAARSEAERLSHLKDEFLSTLSHELRTPLNAVYGWTQVLRRAGNPEQQGHALEVIDRNLKAQAQIINDLLDMSRIMSGKMELEVQKVDLQTVIQSSIESVRQAAEAKRIRLTSVLDSAAGPVRGDPNRLQQVMWNLLTNAIKFTKSGGRVQIALERVNSHVEISVEDNGIGIKPELLPFVFERFRQGDSSITRLQGGLGLGLSIVKNLVELHGGQVRVKSPGDGQGSTFAVCLPVAHVHHRTEVEASKRRSDESLDTAALPELGGARILIVDDEPDGRELLDRILTDQGADCTQAASAKDALGKLGEFHFDILLSDVGMPEMDGYELIRLARRLDESRSKALPAVAITAYARPEDRQRSLMAGYQAHLNKPVEVRELVATLAGLLQLTR